jgi:hypothetical protein
MRTAEDTLSRPPRRHSAERNGSASAAESIGMKLFDLVDGDDRASDPLARHCMPATGLAVVSGRDESAENGVNGLILETDSPSGACEL